MTTKRRVYGIKSNAFLCGESKWIAAITTCFIDFGLIFKSQEEKGFF